MKQMTGITRVTLKKRDGLIFVINEPEVLKSGSNDNSFAVFGELKLEDPNARMRDTEAKTKFGEKPHDHAHDHKGHDHDHDHDHSHDHKHDHKHEEDKKVEDNGAPESEEGLTPNHIDMVMQHANCSRNTAIRALREANDDMVGAVMKLTN